MPPEEKALFDKLRRPVYGFARSGRDFIMSFAGWLIMNRWLTVPEAPALHVLWHDGDDAGVRGASWTKCAGEGGGDILCRTLARREWWTAESVTDALVHAKSVLGKSSRCATMTTHVDDCDLNSAKPLRALVWKVVRTQFAAKDPVQMQKFLGVVQEAWDSASSVVVSDSLKVITQRRSWKTL